MFGITEISQTVPVLCEVKLCRKTIFTSNQGTDCLPDLDVIDDYFKVCTKNIMNQKPRGGTDIIGAIDKSVRVAKSQGMDGEQTLIILSDFMEYRIKELPTPTFSLENYHVLLVYRVQLASDVTKEFVLPEDEVKKYAAFLESTGARNVVVVFDESDFSIHASDQIH